MEACVELPEALSLSDEDGHAARIDRYEVQLVTSCQAAPEGPAGLPLACSLVGSDLLAEAVPGEDAAALAAVLQSLHTRLEPAWVELVVSPDGQLRRFALHDVPARDRRSRAVAEALGWMVERAFIGLDLAFSPTGALSWGERNPALLTYLPANRSAGAARLLDEGALSADGALLEVKSRGRGVIMADPLSARGGGSPVGGLSLSMAAQSRAQFDVAEGTLEARSWEVLSRTTPGAGLDASTMRRPYAMAGEIERLQPGAKVQLSPTGVWGSSPPGGACQALDAARASLEAALDAPLTAPQ